MLRSAAPRFMSSCYETFCMFSNLNRPNWPDFSGRQFPTPIRRPPMSNHVNNCSRSTNSGSTSTRNVTAHSSNRARAVPLRSAPWS